MRGPGPLGHKAQGPAPLWIHMHFSPAGSWAVGMLISWDNGVVRGMKYNNVCLVLRVEPVPW